MATLADNVLALGTKIDALTAAIAAVPPGAATDLTPVLEAVADVKAQLVPTPST